MYKLNLVKKRKRIKRAAIISGIGAIGVTTMVIVAFLGRTVGSFTVILHNDGLSLTMSEKKSFENPTTYLNARGLESFSGAHTYKWFYTSEKYSFEQIHNEETSSDLGKETTGTGIRFFKYTFYIKNTGTLNTGFDMDIKLTETVKPTNGAAPLEDYLRLAVFKGEGNYNPDVYAKASEFKEPSEDGSLDKREYVSGDPTNKDNYYELAYEFADISNNVLATLSSTLEPQQIEMYTLLFWLEGYDRECKDIPDQASLRIGATINAYPEKEKTN